MSMIFKRNFLRLIVEFITIQFLFLLLAGFAFSLNIGDPFPSFTTDNNLSPDECLNLGIECDKYFSFEQLQQECIVVEFLNVYCHTCRMQVEIFNDLFIAVEKDPVLLGHVAIIGIAVGNTSVEVDEFRKNFGALYPVIADPKKKIFYMTGNIQGTPHTYILKKEEEHFIIDYHAGAVSSKDRYLSTIKLAFRSSFAGTNTGNKAPGYSFVSGGILYDENKFEGRKVILYFPAVKKYPVDIDVRNTNNQIEILHKILVEFPDISVVVFEYNGFPVDLEKEIVKFSFIMAETEDKTLHDVFASPDQPTIYYINDHGRIVYKGDSITLYNAQDILKGTEYKPPPVINDKDVIKLIDESMGRLGNKVLSTEKLIMDDSKAIYVTKLFPENSGVYLFSLLESRPSLCDVCHDTHYIYIIDRNGRIIDFIPVRLTKLNNISWSEEDLKKIKDSVVGRNIFENFSFNPKVDAVSTATMTSSLVFESLNLGKNVLEKFKDYGFRSEFWKQRCFENICKIKNKFEQMNKLNKINIVLNEETLNKLMSDGKLSRCPLDGMYFVLDGDILCSVHGLNTYGCK
jgi:hypothetical protein